MRNKKDILSRENLQRAASQMRPAPNLKPVTRYQRLSAALKAAVEKEKGGNSNG